MNQNVVMQEESAYSNELEEVAFLLLTEISFSVLRKNRYCSKRLLTSGDSCLRFESTSILWLNMKQTRSGNKQIHSSVCIDKNLCNFAEEEECRQWLEKLFYPWFIYKWYYLNKMITLCLDTWEHTRALETLASSCSEMNFPVIIQNTDVNLSDTN